MDFREWVNRRHVTFFLVAAAVAGVVALGGC